MGTSVKIRINFIICAIILFGFIAVGFTSYDTYSDVIRDDIANISKLTATNIYSDIRNELTKPIFVSLTMANDNFLKKWLKGEASGDLSADHQKELQNYLLGIKDKYGYDSVFLISQSSKNYYHYLGINKVVSPDDEHDKWYYNFLAKNAAYGLDVDTDEVNHNRLSVFINCRITDENGKLLGVTGVGLEINQVQDLLKSFEKDFQLEAILFNKDGTVQVYSNEKEIEHKNVFEIGSLKDHIEKVLDNHNSLEVYQYDDQLSDGYLITRYIEDLDWYLLVKKDTSVLVRSFHTQLIRDFIIFVLVVLFVLLFVNRIIMQKEKALVTMARTDMLTSLLNRRGFNEQLAMIVSSADENKPFHVFVFDIDNFKKINDLHGHLIGDKILRLVAMEATKAFAHKGAISRWGGDEFAGYIFGGESEVMGDIARFFKRIQEDPEFRSYNTTVSMGITGSHRIDTADTLIYRADQALYEAKGSGKNKYVVMESTHHE